MSKTASFWIGMGLAAAIAAPAAAQQSANAAPDPAHVRELIRQAAQQAQPQSQSPAGAPTQTFVTAGPRVNLTIEEAAQRGTEKNIDIAVARITPRLTDFTIAGLEANYRLNLTSSANNTKRNHACRSRRRRVSHTPTTSIRENWSAGIAQNLYHGGGNYNVNWTNSRLEQPEHGQPSQSAVQLGHHRQRRAAAVRGFKIDATRAALQTNRLSQQNDEITLQSTIDEHAGERAQCATGIWCSRSRRSKRRRTRSTSPRRLVQDNQSRVEIGTLAPIDVVAAQAEQATVARRWSRRRRPCARRELALKRLIVSGTDDPLWTSSINPVDRPPTTPEPINLEAAVTRALGSAPTCSSRRTISRSATSTCRTRSTRPSRS